MFTQYMAKETFKGEDDEDGRQCWLFALFILRSWEVLRDDTPLSPLFLSNYRAEEKHTKLGKGRRGHLHSEMRSQIGGYIASYINNHRLRFKNGSTMILFSNSSPTRLLLKLPTVYRPILQFSPNCMDLKLVKSEDRAQ